MRNILLLALVSAFAIGCAGVKIGPLDPKPKIKVEPQDARLVLSFGAEVPDKFTVPAEGGVRKVKVKGWHETLTNGFENGLKKAFDLQPPDAEHDLMLVFVQADLQFLPVPGIGTEGTTAAKAQLIYQVRVLSADGDVVAATAGELTSKGTWVDPGEQNEIVVEVIKEMYKDIAFEMVTEINPDEAPAPAEEPTE